MDQQTNNRFSGNQTEFPEEEIHITDYLNVLRRHKWVAIIAFVAIVAIGTIHTFRTTPVYQTSSKILIQRQDSFMDDMSDVKYMDNITFYEGYYETYHSLLQSRTLAAKVIKELDLVNEFASIGAEKKPDFVSASIRKIKNLIGSIGSVNVSESQEEEEDLDVPVYLVNWYLGNLGVSPIRETRLVNVSFTSTSPKLAKRIANAHSKAFIDMNKDENRMESVEALDWLKKQLHNQQVKVGLSQQKIIKYKYDQLGEFTVYDDSFFSIPEIAENPIIFDLRKQLSDLTGRKLELATIYEPRHPLTMENNENIKNLEQKIVAQVKLTREKIKTDLDMATVLEEPNNKFTNAGLKEAVVNNDKKRVNYKMLLMEAERDKKIYDILLTRTNEIGLTGNFTKSNIRIVDKAELPRYPIKPRIFINILLSIVLGLTCGVGLAFFFEYMDKTVKTSEDVVQRVGMKVLGVVPYDRILKKNKGVVMLPDKPGHQKKEKAVKIINDTRGYSPYGAYNLAGNFLTRLPSMQFGMRKGQSFMVGSTKMGEGKTTVLAKSAISMAKSGLKVAAIDADLQRPALHKALGVNLNESAGLVNLMTDIVSHDISHGTLDKCSLCDLFFLISLKKLSGQLVITSDEQTITTTFENGCLIYIHDKNMPFNNRIGTMLVRGGLISDDQMKDALDRNQRTGQPLGYILVNSGYINHGKLQGPLKLQIEEQLQKLFSWKQGSFVFEPGTVVTHEDKKIYFEEDYAPVINRLSSPAENHFLKSQLDKHMVTVNGHHLKLLTAGIEHSELEGAAYFAMLEKLFTVLKSQFDVVLVDAPPMMALDSAAPLLSLVDGVIFIIKSGEASVSMINKAKAHMQDANANIVGAVLNQAKNENSYGYYGYYGYKSA